MPTKIFAFTEFLICRIVSPPHPGQRGVSRSSRHAGWAAVDASHIGAIGIAGRATVSEGCRAHDRCDQRTAKPCRPGARGLCAKSCGDVAARPGTRISDRQGDGGNSASLPRGELGISRQTTAQGRPCVGLHLYAAVRSFNALHLAQRTAGASRHPAFPAPSWTKRVKRSSKARANCVARARKRVRDRRMGFAPLYHPAR